ncbi:uncharacterized protein LOC142178095 [Nicotiana tabacum]|uniref:Uncharacterized protein LOC142178095 n=1 Tax=Nicotiana tabacum TaxID=4097 RepID=A0AC58U208_TOBAC
MYLKATRPDILYDVSLLSRFTNCSTDTYFRAAKRVMRYVNGRLIFGIKFYANQKYICREVFVDNQAAIAISNNLVFHGKTKHFNIKLFYLRDLQKERSVRLKYCKSDPQLVDIFTKALPKNKFEFLREAWNLQQLKQGGRLNNCLSYCKIKSNNC